MNWAALGLAAFFGVMLFILIIAIWLDYIDPDRRDW